MKLFFPLCFVLLSTTVSYHTQAQCTAASLNWDALDFLREGSAVSNAIATNQKFAFGTNKLTLGHNYSPANVGGEVTTHTGEGSSYGTGADLRFLGNGIITLNFSTAVQNVRFSIYDVDYNQRITITANNSGTPVNISMWAASGLNPVIIGSGTTTVSATALATHLSSDGASDGNINMDIADQVTSITITVTQTNTKNSGSPQESGAFYISDIQACTPTPAFPSAYHLISRPFTNQPAYVLASRDDSVLMVDVATGVSKFLMKDANGHNINSMGYDPYNKILYFTNSLTGPLSGGNPTINPNNKTIFRYNYNTNTISTFVADVTSLGIPAFNSGVESGAASFYDGAFYIGIEGSDAEEHIVWRIDLDASLNATTATQVFALPTAPHDWGDFLVTNGVLYDFDGKASGQENFYHLNLQTGGLTTYAGIAGGMRQSSVDWNENLYNTGGVSGSTGEVTPYNGNGTVNTALRRTVTLYGTTPTGSWGDAASAFKPMSDFGDAPAYYDADPMSPAMHDPDPNLRLGATLDYEWNKTASVNAHGDGADEDGIAIVNSFWSSTNSYSATVSAYNNTGAGATLIAWFDGNADGSFQSGEAITVTVPSSASVQNFPFNWTGVGTTLSGPMTTYLRVRITSQTNNMSASYSTGYFFNGEVEDYLVLVNQFPLDVSLTRFEVRKIKDKVVLEWEVADEATHNKYELQRSADGVNWTNLTEKKATGKNSKALYFHADYNPFAAVSYYRIRYNLQNGQFRYSPVEKITTGENILHIYPNPAAGKATIDFNVVESTSAQITVLDVFGKTVLTQSHNMKKGWNSIPLSFSNLSTGMYSVHVVAGEKQYTQKLFIKGM